MDYQEVECGGQGKVGRMDWKNHRMSGSQISDINTENLSLRPRGVMGFEKRAAHPHPIFLGVPPPPFCRDLKLVFLKKKYYGDNNDDDDGNSNDKEK